MRKNGRPSLRQLLISTLLLSILIPPPAGVAAESAPAISVTPVVPNELNPSGGGAPAASPDQAAAFAWQEFIALNWPAGPQQGKLGQRGAAASNSKFGDPAYQGPLVWETLRGKVEIFPGTGAPPGYKGSSAATSWGYDALPQYNYVVSVPACDPQQANDPVPWVNLDETDQITLDNMYAGVVQASSSPGNSAPQLVRFLAKADRNEYVYVAGNSDPTNPLDQWWSAIPTSVVTATKAYLAQNMQSPPAGSSTLVSLPNNTVELKAAWRPLNPSEIASGRFHTQTARFYEQSSGGGACYRDAVWGLVALHIIQKTPSAPYFIYATFEQADNILTASGQRVEDADGNMLLKPATATTPQTCLVDPRPSGSGGSDAPSTSGMVILTDNPSACKPSKTAQYCGAPGSQLYYRNATFPAPNNQPSGGDICVNRRLEAIPDYAITANKTAHAAISSYLQQQGIKSAPWLSYKLVNVQYYPYDKIPNPSIPNGSPYTANPPYTAANPAPSSYYQANIVVETNRSLQLFAGGLSPNIATEWNQNGSPHKNSYYAGKFYNMGGCMGCHGSQGQNPAGQAGDFSVILARGAVVVPETPALETSQGLTEVKRNRQLTK
ncbi:MAG TPA: hypothetical protein VNH64_10145 [Parvularculaceae bacterium]|nr:hypothetical protein [Parvularculaceae bacterium]